MSECHPVTSALPDLVVAADWSTVETKRWMVRGERVGDGYVVYPPEPVGDHKSLMARLRRALPDDHRLLIGFDFPIGLPVEYAHEASVESFRTLSRGDGRTRGVGTLLSDQRLAEPSSALLPSSEAAVGQLQSSACADVGVP